MTTNPDEIEAEAAAILRVLALAKSQRATRSSAEFDEARVKSAVTRMTAEAQAARNSQDHERAGH
jgi:two-component sensor histidine kinase